MSDIVLYGFGESGNSYKVAMLLDLCGVAWRQQNVDFFAGETRGKAYRTEINEMGEVPVLVMDGVKHTQSGAILSFVAEKYGKFLPKADQSLEALRWLLFDNHKFTGTLSALRFLRAFQKTGETPVTEFLKGRLLSSAGIIDQHLSTRDFMLGAHISYVDLSLAGYLFHPEDYGFDWLAYPHIQAWLKRIAAQPGWRPPYVALEAAPAKKA